MSSYHDFNPCTLLSPVPAVMVSCRGTGPEDKPNIITVAWAGTVNSDPPMISVSIKPQRFSHDLIQASGEFVVNLVDQAHCRALDFCGVRSGKDLDKFEQCGLKTIPAINMKYAPAIEGLPAYLACKVRQVIPLGSHDMFIGEVIGIQVRDDQFDEDGSLHLERSGLVCYNHGVYQKAAEVLGFFGYSVARPDVREKRMKQYRPVRKK